MMLYPELVVDSACAMEEKRPRSEGEERTRQGRCPVRDRMLLERTVINTSIM